LKHDYFTDVITFDYSDNQAVSGDLFVSVDRVLDNANSLRVEAKDELVRVVFHGVLHLIGFKDKTEEEKVLMTAKENEYLYNFVSRETKG
jgi:rRNA maturation RNase YbeY